MSGTPRQITSKFLKPLYRGFLQQRASMSTATLPLSISKTSERRVAPSAPVQYKATLPTNFKASISTTAPLLRERPFIEVALASVSSLLPLNSVLLEILQIGDGIMRYNHRGSVNPYVTFDTNRVATDADIHSKVLSTVMRGGSGTELNKGYPLNTGDLTPEQLAEAAKTHSVLSGSRVKSTTYASNVARRFAGPLAAALPLFLCQCALNGRSLSEAMPKIATICPDLIPEGMSMRFTGTVVSGDAVSEAELGILVSIPEESVVSSVANLFWVIRASVPELNEYFIDPSLCSDEFKTYFSEYVFARAKLVSGIEKHVLDGEMGKAELLINELVELKFDVHYKYRTGAKAHFESTEHTPEQAEKLKEVFKYFEANPVLDKSLLKETLLKNMCGTRYAAAAKAKSLATSTVESGSLVFGSRDEATIRLAAKEAISQEKADLEHS